MEPKHTDATLPPPPAGQPAAPLLHKGRGAVYALSIAGAGVALAGAVARLTDGKSQPPWWAIGIGFAGTALWVTAIALGIRYRRQGGRLLFLPATVLAATFASMALLSWPLTLYSIHSKVVVGRPVRQRRGRRRAVRIILEPGLYGLAEAAAGTDKADTNKPDPSWLRVAREEWEAAGAFAQLAAELELLDAPATLVDRAHAAVGEEVDHARRCLRLAGGGTLPIVTVRARVPRSRTAGLARLAAESLVDGCVNEGAAAAELVAMLEAQPALTGELSDVVADELGHTELAWDIVCWTVEAGGAPVRFAIAHCGRQLRPDVHDPPSIQGSKDTVASRLFAARIT